MAQLPVVDGSQQSVNGIDGKDGVLGGKAVEPLPQIHLGLVEPPVRLENAPVVGVEPLDGGLVHAQLPELCLFLVFPFEPLFFGPGLVVSHKNTSI